MKKNTLKNFLLIVILLASLALFGCQEKTPNIDESQNSGEVNEEDTGLKYGVLATQLQNYNITPIAAEVPQVYQENGKFGFKDKNGKIILPATYDKASEFHSGYGSVRTDTIANNETKYTWSYVSAKGKIVEYDYISGFFDELPLAISIAGKDEKYCLLNSELTEIIPLEYNILTANYNYGEENWSSYGKNDTMSVKFDLVNGTIYSYEKYNPSNKGNYIDIIDLSEYSIAIVNNLAVINGITDQTGKTFPFPILEMLDFDIYVGSEKIGTQKPVLTPSLFEGQLEFSFTDIDPNKGYFAIPSGSGSLVQGITKDTQTDKYESVVKSFMQDKGIENTPYSINQAFTGDFYGNGKTGAMIAFADYNIKDDVPEFRNKAFNENWSDDKFIQEKMGIFGAIIYIPDIKEMGTFETICNFTYQNSDIRNWQGFDIVAIIGLLEREGKQLIVKNSGYDIVSYSIIDLK